jgi:hypothetical protein
MEHLLLQRLNLGKIKYGHGVRVDLDTITWGTVKNSWLEMANEEFLDGIVYVVCDYIRRGRKNPTIGICALEREFISVNTSQSDDNELILYIIRNAERIESDHHRKMISSLINLVDMCLLSW